MNQLFYIKSKYLIDITEGYDTKKATINKYNLLQQKTHVTVK